MGFSSESFECNLSSFEGSVLSGDHDSESIKVSGLGSQSESGHFLSSAVGGPFLVESVSGGSFLEVTSSDSSEDSWNKKSGEIKSLDWIKNSWEFTKSIDLNSVLINHINNNNHFSIVFSIVDVCNSTCLNDISKTL